MSLCFHKLLNMSRDHVKHAVTSWAQNQHCTHMSLYYEQNVRTFSKSDLGDGFEFLMLKCADDEGLLKMEFFHNTLMLQQVLTFCAPGVETLRTYLKMQQNHGNPVVRAVLQNDKGNLHMPISDMYDFPTKLYENLGNYFEVKFVMADDT